MRKFGSFRDHINILKNKIKHEEMDGKKFTEDLPNLEKEVDWICTSLPNSANIQLRELQPIDLNTGRTYQTEDENMLPAVENLTVPPIELDGWVGLNGSGAKESVSKPETSAQRVLYKPKKRMTPKRFIPHDCNPQCLYIITRDLKEFGPLMKPMLSGWERVLFNSKFTKFVVYKAPCGRMITNMNELHRYLVVTDNVLNVNNFDFDINVECMQWFRTVGFIVQKRDISQKKENMVIPCINQYDNSIPNEYQYSTKRIPTEGVYLNLDPEFLAGCDCEDDCSIKENCSCWKLTLAGAKFVNVRPENYGYQYKRLPERAPTGIYECNVNCKCTMKCHNRVVQQQLEIPLQLFKTSNRGWGLRCLNDIPKGSFICIYAGELLTDRTADEGGADEYFADLDYIEVAQQLKKGYESDVLEDTEDSDEEYEEPTRKRSKHGKENSKNRKHHDDDNKREFLNFEPSTNPHTAESSHRRKKIVGTRKLFGKKEHCYVMDAKRVGNIARYFNHSCSPNMFVQSVFVDTHDLRFPWVALFAMHSIRAGTELTWNYHYVVGSIPGKVLYCKCGASDCAGRLL